MALYFWSYDTEHVLNTHQCWVSVLCDTYGERASQAEESVLHTDEFKKKEKQMDEVEGGMGELKAHSAPSVPEMGNEHSQVGYKTVHSIHCTCPRAQHMQ